MGRDRATEKLVEKYRGKKIRAWTDFRRIMESYEINEDDPQTRARFSGGSRSSFLNPSLETRDGFDEFVMDKKRVLSALAACDEFLTELQRFRLLRIPLTTRSAIACELLSGGCRHTARAYGMRSKGKMTLRSRKTNHERDRPQPEGRYPL